MGFVFSPNQIPNGDVVNFTILPNQLPTRDFDRGKLLAYAVCLPPLAVIVSICLTPLPLLCQVVRLLVNGA